MIVLVIVAAVVVAEVVAVWDARENIITANL